MGDSNYNKVVHIFYFSGTCNTKWVVDTLKDKLTDFVVKIYPVEKLREPKKLINDCDIVIIAFPIHSSLAPKPIRDFIDAFPYCIDKPIIGISTAGFMAGDVLEYTLGGLVDKGFLTQIYMNILMGNNFHLPVLSPLKVTNQEKLHSRLIKAEIKLHRLAQYIREGKNHYEGNHFFGRLLGTVQRFFVKNFNKQLRPGFYVDEKCNQCGFCINNCPVDNAVMVDTGVQFSGKCIMCLRCYNFCPRHAIQKTDMTKNILKYARYRGPYKKYLK